MNRFDKILKLISEDLFIERKAEALAKWNKYTEADEYVEKFMNKNNGIRLKVSAPFKN